MELHPNKIKIGNLYKITANLCKCIYTYAPSLSDAKSCKEIMYTKRESPIFFLLKRHGKNKFGDTILKGLTENKIIFLLVDEKKCKFEEIQ